MRGVGDARARMSQRRDARGVRERSVVGASEGGCVVVRRDGAGARVRCWVVGAGCWVVGRGSRVCAGLVGRRDNRPAAQSTAQPAGMMEPTKSSYSVHADARTHACMQLAHRRADAQRAAHSIQSRASAHRLMNRQLPPCVGWDPLPASICSIDPHPPTLLFSGSPPLHSSCALRCMHSATSAR